MSEPRLYTFAERPDLMDHLGEVTESSWPEFMLHTNVAKELWRELRAAFLDFQWVLHDEEADEVVGLGNSVPLSWDGEVGHLPDGFDAVLQTSASAPRRRRSAEHALRVAGHGRREASRPGPERPPHPDDALGGRRSRVRAPHRSRTTHVEGPVPAGAHRAVHDLASRRRSPVRPVAAATREAGRADARAMSGVDPHPSRRWPSGNRGPAWHFRKAATTSCRERWRWFGSTANATPASTSSRTCGSVTIRYRPEPIGRRVQWGVTRAPSTTCARDSAGA